MSRLIATTAFSERDMDPSLRWDDGNWWKAVVAECLGQCHFADMGKQSALKIAEAFLDILWADPPPGDQELAIALDRLLAATHDVEPIEGVDVFTPSPECDWQALYKEIGERFSDYGYYAVASPLEVVADACMTGDAIDDLADITKDLREVLWRGAALGSDEATWHFRFAYDTHWGRHARELALYLHARITAAG